MFTIIVISWLAGMVTQFALSRYVWPRRHRVYTWVFRMRDHRGLGAPSEADIVLDRDGFCLGYSHKRRCAKWVMYIVSEQSVGVDRPRKDNYYADTAIPPKYRVIPEDFANSGYDKGHLVPAASVDFSRRAVHQSYAMTNIALQHPKLNRQAWGHLERLIRKWTTLHGKLAITAGPIYGKRNKRINDIPIPRMFFKVIYAYGEQRCIGFILPNKDVPNDQLWKHAVTVAEVEQKTGFVFFTGIGNLAQAKEQVDLDFWQLGL